MTWPVAVSGSVAKTDFNNLVTVLKNEDMIQNILINGGFEIWQRGNSFTGADKYTADMWYMGGGGSGYTITRESSNLHSGIYSLKVVCTSNLTIKQPIENYKEFQGKTVSFSCWVKSSVASKIYLKIDDGVGNTLSATNATTGWERLTVTRTINASASKFEIYLMVYSSVTVYFDDAILIMGSEAIDFKPRNPGFEQSLCERWYEKGTYRSGIPTTNKELRLACRFRELKAGSTFTVSFVPAIYDDSDTDDTSHWTVNSYYTNDILFIILTRDVAQAGNYYVNADWNVQVDS